MAATMKVKGLSQAGENECSGYIVLAFGDE
jgi:hypothetical protein